jgi:hypothetical protein
LKKNNLIILADSRHSKLGLGDYLRILTFLPNLNYKKCIWISDKKLFPIADNCDFISSKHKINTRNSKKKIIKADLIIDLYNKKIKFENSILINSILKKTKNVKINTLNICDVLAEHFKIKKYKLFTNKKKIKSYNSIFFNWIVPRDWKMKEYPIYEWEKLEIIIKQKYPKINIIWQRTTDNLSKLYKKIENSKIIISTVGLGSHIGMLFNKKIILLCGPTYFNEIKDFKDTKIIKSSNLCKIHKKKINLKVNNCSCMRGIENKKIFFAIKKML